MFTQDTEFDRPHRALLEVLQILNLKQRFDLRFEGRNLPHLNGRVYGGQALAQALMAASNTVPLDDDGAPRLPHSLHTYFTKPGNLNKLITLDVEPLIDGRSFSMRQVFVRQEANVIANLTASFQTPQEGIEHRAVMPAVPQPHSLPNTFRMLGENDDPVAQFFSATQAFDIRHVGANIYSKPDPKRSERQVTWVRSRGPLPEDLSQTEHRALLAFACDQLILEPALRRAGLCWMTPGLKLASLDHTMWWHADVRADQWLCFNQRSPAAGGGRGLGYAEVFNQAGLHVATIAQEGMIRAPLVAG